jgi:glutathione-regulated potassium-efflux system ancillary protein KefC
VPIVIRARSRTDAYQLRDLNLQPIRETFYSSLEAARQALLAIGESATAANKIIKHFEKHDLEQFEAAYKVRNDRQAVLDLSAKGRNDLKALLASERGEEVKDV